MTTPIKINLNNYAIIYPTPAGWDKIFEIITKQYLMTADAVNDYISRRKTHDNGYRDQMWVLMDELNDLFFNGSEYLTSTDIIYEQQ